MADEFERRDVWTLSREAEWHPIIEWYGRAVAALQTITELTDPRSWLGLANIHGTDSPRPTWPVGIKDRDWNACQHSSWYFLPWHRIYLHHFEKIVRGMVVELGGPDDWALPFWNYDPQDPETLKLPPAFRAPTTPTGHDNALFVEQRKARINAGGPLPAENVEITGWSDDFTAEPPVPSFGGPPTGWSHTGNFNGQLEIEPHGFVHVDVGGGDEIGEPIGLMSTFETAAQDPVFWLHHANIDRLWEVWRNNGHGNTDESDWLTYSFVFGSGLWRTEMTPGDVVDTTAAPLLYRYEGVLTAAAEAAPVGARERMMAVSSEKTPPELVGASETPIPLSDVPNLVQVPLSPPTGPAAALARRAAAGEAQPRRVYLTLENVTGTGLGAGSYTVHVGVPEGADVNEYPDRRAGRISTFGVMEASRSDDIHSGSGISFSFDITDLVNRLEDAGDWDPSALRLTITPTKAAGGGRETHDVQVGRIGIYYG